MSCYLLPLHILFINYFWSTCAIHIYNNYMDFRSHRVQALSHRLQALSHHWNMRHRLLQRHFPTLYHQQRDWPIIRCFGYSGIPPKTTLCSIVGTAWGGIWLLLSWYWNLFINVINICSLDQNLIFHMHYLRENFSLCTRFPRMTSFNK